MTAHVYKKELVYHEHILMQTVMNQSVVLDPLCTDSPSFESREAPPVRHLCVSSSSLQIALFSCSDRGAVQIKRPPPPPPLLFVSYEPAALMMNACTLRRPHRTLQLKILAMSRAYFQSMCVMDTRTQATAASRRLIHQTRAACESHWVLTQRRYAATHHF